MKTTNAIDIIERAKRVLSVNSDTEFATMLGISKSTLSNWKSRNSIDYDLLFSYCKQVNFDWLITGEGNMERALPISTENDRRKYRDLIPFYDDIATIGGTNELSSDTDNGNARVAEWIDAGDWFPEATSAIRHYGESMVEYPSGSILALKRVNDRRLIINGRNYVVETTEFRITKQLQDDGGDFLIAYSSNRETYPDGRQIHSPIRIPKDTIRHIDMVLGCVQKEYSNGAIPIRK